MDSARPKRIKGNIPVVDAETSTQQAEDALQRPDNELEDRVKTRTAELARASQELLASEERLEERLKCERLPTELSARLTAPTSKSAKRWVRTFLQR